MSGVDAGGGGRLRIVMMIPYDPYYQPFVTRSIRQCCELVRRGHEVHYFYRPMTASRRGNRVRDRLPPEVRARPLRLGSRGDLRAVRVSVAQSDVVHFQKSKPPFAWVSLGLARAYGKPLHQDWDDDELAFWVQATRDRLASLTWRRPGSALELAKGALMGALSGATERLVPRLADSVGGATMALREHGARLGAPHGAIFAAPVGVDADSFAPSRRDEDLRHALGLDGPTVVYAGSLDVRPDLDFFVAALGYLTAAAPEARCLVIGGGFGRDAFVQRLEEGRLAGVVRMTEGLVRFAEMPRYIASCDIAALPFRDSPVNRAKSSLTLLEAMACGLPSVTHDVGDIGWMLGGGGVVAPLDDPAAFGHVLADLVRRPDERARLGAVARARAAEVFTWSATVDHLEAAYRYAISRRSRTMRV